MHIPSISVITPSCNGGAYLEDAILSVAQQEGVAVEHLVQDSLSSDNTLEILRRHAGVRWQWESDCGQSDAINRGFLRARGDLVGWLNADDYYLPGGLNAIAQAAAEHPEADVFHGDCVFVDGEGSITRSKVEHEFDRDILLYFGCYIPSTATFFRRRVIERGYLLDCDFRVCMDFEYFVRLAGAGFQFHYVPQFVAAFRWHESNVSLQNVERRAQERQEVQCRHGNKQDRRCRWSYCGMDFVESESCARLPTATPCGSCGCDCSRAKTRCGCGIREHKTVRQPGVLVIHNRYQQVGGEDAVVRAEIALLRRNGHRVVEYARDNADIRRLRAVAKGFPAGEYNVEPADVSRTAAAHPGGAA